MAHERLSTNGRWFAHQSEFIHLNRQRILILYLKSGSAKLNRADQKVRWAADNFLNEIRLTWTHVFSRTYRVSKKRSRIFVCIPFDSSIEELENYASMLLEFDFVIEIFNKPDRKGVFSVFSSNRFTEYVSTLGEYLSRKIFTKILGPEMLVDLDNIGIR